ncbi:GNAT family N-acetyltransferase [Hymenobacter sp. GOD-10R]|uniref:GNAT family N-acetyltransferase n=1 Tax=Hymenobacter sp. GOD-10R TaxID=3093922 RepID=UPI002D76B8E9|nr:GNAT family N-acetyltransferase [Hymenobacter sp. GOD-10R]WRQ31198.1 GNAT family N-acetyltransferase [Hymenobacter sp. GOD-10R]
MEHILDNPIWNALTTGNKHLAVGNEQARYLPKDIGAFAGLSDYSENAFARLHEISPFGAPAVLFTADTAIPAGWKLLMQKELLQMVYEQPTTPDLGPTEVKALHDQDIPAMIALTALTNPGPFLARTIAFGGYHGIFQDGQLVAMAGQRLQPTPYTEISAVCTHPDYLGKGYAGQLLRHQIGIIRAAGNTPFLHVFADNTNACGLYEKLGFQTRKQLQVYVLEKQAY